MNYNEFIQVNKNLYQIEFSKITDYRYFRLFGTGITDNGCWIINPKMVELKDIDIPTGKDVYGTEIIINDVIGTVSAYKEYIKY
jgi:hypothetical protein